MPKVEKGAIAWELCQRFIRDRVGGVFFAPLELIPDKDVINRRIAAALDEAKIPVVLLDRDYVKYPGRSNHDLVGINNRRVGHTITDHMFAAGCKRLVFILRPGSASTIHARAAGFAEAFITRRAAFDVEMIHECDPCDTGYIRNMLRQAKAGWHRLRQRRDSRLLAAYARGTWRARAGRCHDRRHRRREICRTIASPAHDRAATLRCNRRAAYHAMLDRIERPNAAPRHITLGCELVIRDSHAEPIKK